VVEPTPVEANGMVPGLAFANAARSFAELAGWSARTTRMVVLLTTSVTGAKSRSVL
jgi:hypothetical protein